MKTIAKHGGLRWEAASETAGPYHLASRFMVFASFGSRSPGVSCVGSLPQIEAFWISRVAFEAIRLHTDATHHAVDLRRYVEIAVAAARAEHLKWKWLAVLHYGSSSKGVENYEDYQKAVDRRFAVKLPLAIIAHDERISR